MAELSRMRAAIARMEEREANASTGASGSSSAPSGAHTTHTHSSALDTPAVAPLPERKALITITMIREYMGLPEDSEDSRDRPNDKRWCDIRVSGLLVSSISLFLIVTRPLYAI